MATSPPASSPAEPHHSASHDSARLPPADPAPIDEASKHGFSRSEMFSLSLAGTVQHYERHVLLCYKDAKSWPPQVETSVADPLPRLLASTLKSRKNDMQKKTRFAVCEGHDEVDSLNGDVLIFPDMVRYKELTQDEIEPFVDEVIVNEREWPAERSEKLEGAHVFVCAHANRDMRCGVCGPALIEKFKNEIAVRDLGGRISVRSCSHVGGHKYAGNVIIYSPNASGEVAGHWYGYVTPEDVATLLDEHIGKFTIIERLWRGQMGVIETEQKEAQQQRCQTNGVHEQRKDSKEGCICSQVHEQTNGYIEEKINVSHGCCQEKAGKSECGIKAFEKSREAKTGQGHFSYSWSRASSFFDSWERGDTLAALAVAGAVAAVVVAFHLCRKPS